jgi:hypothetical protein
MKLGCSAASRCLLKAIPPLDAGELPPMTSLTVSSDRTAAYTRGECGYPQPIVERRSYAPHAGASHPEEFAAILRPFGCEGSEMGQKRGCAYIAVHK